MFFRQQAETVSNFPGSTLASVGELFSQLGLGVAESQAALDDNSIKQALILAGVLNPDGTAPPSGQSANVPMVGNKSLLELGFVPTFYFWEYVDISVSMFVSLTYERSEDFGFDIGYTSGKTSSSDVNATNTGSMTITVVQGEARAAKGKVVVKKAQQGAYLAVDGDKIEIVQTGSDPLHVPITPRGLYQTSQRIADKLRSTDMPKIGRVETKVTSRGISNLDTNDPAHFKLDPAGGTIRLAGGAATPARAWFALRDNAQMPGSISVKLTGSAAFETSVDVTGASPTPDVTAGGDMADTANLIAARIGTSPLFSSTGTKVLFAAGAFAHTFLFDHDKSDVATPPAVDSTPQERSDRLDLLAQFLKNTGVSVQLIGHTDSSGSSPYNVGLGQRRADAVHRALTARGVSPTQLEAKSEGESNLVSGQPPTSVYQRRVEVKLKTPLETASILQVESNTTAVPKTWDTTVAAANGITGMAGSRLGLVDGNAASPIAVSDWVEIRSSTQSAASRYTAVASGATAAQFDLGSGVLETAANLATAINEADQGGVNAYSEGSIVYLLGPGSEVELTMYAATAGKQGNDLSLATDGSSIVVPPDGGFSGGANAGTPSPKSASNPTGDSVSLGDNVFTLVSSSPTGTEFVLGDDAAKTAKNLADKINGIAGFSAAVPTGDADTINVTGPTGTSVSTSNPTAFVLSSPKIGGFLANATADNGQWKAFAVTAGYHFSQKFDVTASGNATISGKLKSVPPPAQFIQSLTDWQSLFQ